MGIEYSSEKAKKLKQNFVYFNHNQELDSFNRMNIEYIPQEFRFLLEQNRSSEVISFYNFYYGLMLNEAEGHKINKDLAKVLSFLDENHQKELRNNIVKNNTFDPLVKKAKATYQIDLDRSKGNQVTQSLLHIFASAYENTECLYVLSWIGMGINKKSMQIEFNKFKDSFGNIKKGKLINELINAFKKYPEFRDIIKKAYNKKLRNLCAHNAAMLDNQTRMIIGIDDDRIRISYEEAFQSFYALQQLHNYIRMYVNVILIDEEEVKKEGFFKLITFNYEDDTKELALLQLFPFIDFDQQEKSELKKVTIRSKEDSYDLISDEKIIINVIKDQALETWFENGAPEQISIYSAYPDIYKDSSTEGWTRVSTKFGNFICNFGYESKLEFE